MQMISRLYSFFFLSLAIGFIHWVDFNSTLLMICVVIPFILLSMWYEQKDPLLKKSVLPGEIRTDLSSFAVVLVLTMGQNFLVHLYFYKAISANNGVSLFLANPYALSQLPFWAECALAFLVYDFVFYWMHRIAHNQDFMWRLHAVHHCADKLNYLNSNRIHPLDMLIRRVVPMLVVMSLGVSEKAFIFIGVLINILGPVSHFNINLRHGIFNYLIGTNEVHIWHHSVKAEEARNFGITMLWDHLFGTFYYPKDRRAPEKIGLMNEDGYPTQSYLKQIVQPFLPAKERLD